MILYINSCVRADSRTDRLARAYLGRYGEYEEIKLTDAGIKPLDAQTLDHRTELIEKRDFSNSFFKLADQFASADEIVISAPYWDMSFPSLLKVYLENIYAVGIVSSYDENGIPVGLCKARRAVYITTAGGRFIPTYSYGYISDLFKGCFGISETVLIKAEMLDIAGNDPGKILDDAIKTYGLK